jgi:hypothetical protein
MPSLVPTTIPGCQLWLDANDPNANNTAGTNGGTVSTWHDKSGNSRNMTLTGTGVTYANGYQNSLNTISLLGTAIVGKVIIPAGTFSSNYTGFAVYRNTKNVYHVMMARTSPGAYGIFDNFATRRFTSTSHGNSTTIGYSSTPDLDQNMGLWNFGLNNYAATGGTGTYNEYYNGTASTFSAIGGGQRTGLNAADFNENMYFVGRAGIPAEVAGHYCEIIVYNTNLSETQRQDIEGYLAWKWGIQSRLPASHPYSGVPLVLLNAINYTSGTWNDDSGNGRNASLEVGTASKNAAGNGLVLNGSTAWTFPNVALGNVWSIGVWYKNTGSPTGNPALITQKTSGSSINAIVGYFNGTSYDNRFFNGSYYTGTPFTFTNAWTNVQVTWDGTNLRTYINGSLVSSIIGGVAVDNGSTYRIGGDIQETPVGFLTGEIGEVRIYKHALTASDLSNDYNSSYNTFYTPPPVRLLDLATNATDTGSSPQTVIINGNVQYRTISNVNCVYFNNLSANYLSTPFPTSQSFTVSYWFYSIDGGTYDPWSVSTSATGSGLLGINPDIANGNQNFYMDCFAGGRIDPGGFALPAISGKWIHIALSVNTVSAVVRSYLNGVFKKTVTGSGAVSKLNHLILGKDATGARAYNGYLRNFAVYNYILPDTQIKNDYRAAFPIIYPPLLTNFLELSANTTDTGSSPQTVTKAGSVPFQIIASNKCAYFNNSTNNYLSTPFTLTPQFTMTWWFYVIDGNQYNCWGVSSNSTGTGALGINADLNNGTLGFTIDFTGGRINPGFTLPTVSGAWYHVALSVDTETGVCKTYLDGVFKNSATGSGTINNNLKFLIMGKDSTNARAYNGYLRDFSIFNYILTDTQVSNNYGILHPNTIITPTTPVVSIGSLSPTSFTATWTGGTNATSYTYKLNNVTTVPSTDSVSGKTATFTGLLPETSYSLLVTALNSIHSTSAVSTSVSATTLILPPTAPVVTITLLRDTSFTATWTGGTRATSYTYSIDGNFVIPSTDAGVASKSASFTGLLANTTYSLVIAAINSTGPTYSFATILTTLPPPPTVPLVTITKITALGFSASWTGATGATSYTFALNGTAATASVTNTTAKFTGLLPDSPYSLVVTATNASGSTNSASVSTRTLTSPTKPTGLTASVTSDSFLVSWTGGEDVTSYTYLLNSSPFTPIDNGILNQTANFLGLIELTNYTCTVIASNSYGIAASDILSVTTSKRPPPTTQLAALKLQQVYTNVPIVNPEVAAAAIQEGLVNNSAATVAVAAMSLGTAVMFTALVNNANFMGTTITIPAPAAGLLYNSFANKETLDISLPLYVSFPDASGVATPLANNNSKLAIDLTVDQFVRLKGTEYGIRVAKGVQYFVTPTDASGSLINVGDVLTLVKDSDSLSFTVADLDIVLIPYKEPVSFICFLGSAPVLTPSGYTRIDRLAVGDIVTTPKGTAIVEAIKTQLCEPSKYSNPYAIPEGVFGANRKLLISPRHKVSVSGHMFEARQLGLEQEVQAKPFTYYNIQITGTQNMIVAGVEVESLKPLVRITVSREAFEFELAKMGGMTPEIRARCHFLADGSVSVPALA